VAKNQANPISGVYTAIVTPFRQDRVDFDALDRLLLKQSEAGVDGVVVAGTTGESPTLSDEEKVSLVTHVKKNHSQLKVMGGSGSNNTAHTLKLSKAMHEAGADSLLVVTPPYNKPSPEGLKAHFQAVSDATPLPLCLYHVPGRTAQKLSAATLSDLCKVENVKAVKEASADLSLFSDACRQSDAAYLSGDDFTYLASLAVGGVGVVSVLTNVAPKAFVRLTDLAIKGDYTAALSIHNALFPLYEALFIESNPSPSKHILTSMRLIDGDMRLPLVPVTPKSAKTIDEVYRTTLAKLNDLGIEE